ncbi:uncharacterized protein JN550_013187 [Neoarthrinium moseri]|uniref:uncharacterized protein n=1 Tax=Neoarthrinium moseri TaxID=1658444 RepID=UPI001FDDD9E7|nr:uncharacterized protein JN550_013187 [Neoarthrinium moseri]KAI1857554.1 hypothetical protein JN550_013187 [Neoarthrinium moseri]
MAATNGEPEVRDVLLSLVFASRNTRSLTDIDKCLGLNGNHEPCGNPNGKERKARATAEYNLLLGKQVPLDEEAVVSIETFLNATHCRYHVGKPLARLRQWMLNERVDDIAACSGEGTDYEIPSASQNHTTTSVDKKPGSPGSKTNQQVLPVDLDSHVDQYSEGEAVSEYFSDLTISPGQESNISFNSASPASTTLTTPDTTPISLRDLPILDQPGSRPETPCPMPKSKDVIITEQDLEQDDEAKEFLVQEDRKGVEMRDNMIRRIKTQKRGKLPLLIGIMHDWTPLDHEVGLVYVYKHDKQAGLIKIGWTRHSSTQRYSQSGNCYAVNSKPYWESPTSFVGAYRVEQLTQKQLQEWNVDKDGCANCKKRHREWFRYDADEATKLIQVWTEFVTGDYYDRGSDSDGKKFGWLSQTGREFMDRLCNVNPDTIIQHMQAESIGASVVGQRGRDNESATRQTTSEPEPVSRQDIIVESIPENDESRDEICGESAAFLSQEKTKRQGKTWHIKQAAKTRLHSAMDAVPESLRRGLASTMDRFRESNQKSPPQLPPGSEETMQSFYARYYANEIRELEELLSRNVQGRRSKPSVWPQWLKRR